LINELNKDSHIIADSYDIYLMSLLGGDKEKCRQMIDLFLTEKVDIITLYIELFQRSMYEIGDLWGQNKISVANEHLASIITEELLNLVYPKLFPGQQKEKKAVVCCVPNENHQIGAKMIADIFEMQGWDTYFLGSNLPVHALLDFVRRNQPELVALSVSILDHFVFLEDALQQLQANFPELTIIVGGQGLDTEGLGIVNKYSNLKYIEGLVPLEKYIKDL
jgi:MerR family transcriptional regulator, light-induced transcriptional regulator